MKARRDTSEYGGACQNMENWVPTAQGGMIRRSGSWYGGLKLDPPPTPPTPPPPSNVVIPPINYATDGEWHGYSVRRRLNPSYEGPLILVGRDSSVSGNDDRIPIGTTQVPDENGVYWIDEVQILQAFVATGQNPAVSEARLSIYAIYDQTTQAAVVPRNLTSADFDFKRAAPFAFTGQFGSFAYVNVPANETGPDKARCQMGCAIPWRNRLNERSTLTYDDAFWDPTVGDLANGGIMSVAALDGSYHVGNVSNPNTRRSVHGINYSSSPFLKNTHQNGSNGPGATCTGDRAFDPVGNLNTPGTGTPVTTFQTSSQFNAAAHAYKFDVPTGEPAFAYSVINSRSQQVTTTGTTNAEPGGSLSSSGSNLFKNILADADGNAFADYLYWNFTDWWFLMGDTGPWGGNSAIINPVVCQELAKTVKLEPENAMPIP